MTEHIHTDPQRNKCSGTRRDRISAPRVDNSQRRHRSRPAIPSASQPGENDDQRQTISNSLSFDGSQVLDEPDRSETLATAIAFPADPALPQAGVALLKVDVEQGYRMSKLIGSGVRNDKNEKIGSLDDVIADKDNKHLSFAVLQIGGFLAVGVAVPFDKLFVDNDGGKITLPGASKDELKSTPNFTTVHLDQDLKKWSVQCPLHQTTYLAGLACGK